jgi:ribosomal protein L30/L7E
MSSWKEFSTMNILGLLKFHTDVLVRDARDKKESFVLAA